MTESEHFVSVSGLTKRFGENEVLREGDLTVDLHHVVCLIGASGSGKSTLLRCLNLLETVDAGTIVIDGQTVTNGKVDVIDASATDVATRVRELTDGKGADIVLNTVGHPSVQAAPTSLGLRGHQTMRTADDRVVRCTPRDFSPRPVTGVRLR